jgi:hypothetical protein
VPHDFFGVAPQSSVTSSDLSAMQNAHAHVSRQQFYWPSIEPSKGSFNWSGVDQLVGNLAAHGVRTLPYLDRSPSWVAPQTQIPPIHSRADRKAWRHFVSVAVRRYGPGGSFWHGRSHKKPIRTWLIWNEENGKQFWQPRPSPKGYGKLLKIAGHAIHHVAPHSKVVVGGLSATPTRGINAWTFLRRLYHVNGIRRAFNGVGIHPYSKDLAGVRQAFGRVHRVMKQKSDGQARTYGPEIGWSSASSSQVGPLGKGLKGQARMLRRAFRLLLHHRRRWNVTNIDWYALRDTTGPTCDWCGTSGLLYGNGSPKPSYHAFKRLAG